MRGKTRVQRIVLHLRLLLCTVAKARLRSMCNVTRAPFGAVGDGMHDDTAAARRALKECDSVLLPKGLRSHDHFGESRVRGVVTIGRCNYVNPQSLHSIFTKTIAQRSLSSRPIS